MIPKEDKILLVDDSDTNIAVLGSLLKDNGFKFAIAQNGYDALEILQRESIDIILLDVMMPGIDGFETCRRIKTNPAYADTPVIFISALKNAENIVNGFEAGGSDYIAKPFQVNEVLTRIQNHLNLVNAHKKIAGLNLKISEQIKSLQQAHHNLNKKNSSTKNSIQYASGITKAVMPQKEQITELLPESFLIFEPCEVVGGDFYWIKKIGEYLYLCLGDCTGHGVPGAFLSLLAITSLNERLLKSKSISPADIIQILQTRFSKSFSNVAAQKHHFDMDLGICKISLAQKKLWYSGVQFPLYLCRNNEIEQYRLNRHSLSFTALKSAPIETLEINIKPGDAFYLTSDGYQDQPGNSTYSKIGKRRLRNLMLSNYKKSPDEQKQSFYTFFNNWKGVEDQIDDVSLLGFKIP